MMEFVNVSFIYSFTWTNRDPWPGVVPPRQQETSIESGHCTNIRDP